MEEFQEHDVLWPEETQNSTTTDKLLKLMSSADFPKKLTAMAVSRRSNPITIPAAASGDVGRRRRREIETLEFRRCRGSGGLEEIVPPHLIVSRRCSGEVPFSVCTGSGRTLKGRDLRQVRNCVLRLTGFLEG